MKVLLIDDDPDYSAVIQIGLESDSIQCTLTSSGEEALELLRSTDRPHFDAMLVDIELPGVSGWEVLAALRESGEEAPILFVSGFERVEERVRALRLGADDYLVKPVNLEELAARLQAALRARQSLPSLVIEDLRLDLAQRKAFRNGSPIHLSPKEFDLLLALAQAEGEVISRKEILERVWDMPFDPGTNLLDVHIGRLRKKMGRSGSDMIQTERGKGYRLGTSEPSRSAQPPE
ncbi:MAG: response regulator transcription factor [Planctomycetota bacterium]|nr:response regulator transcription factor [Planctomycetota bacterium]